MKLFNIALILCIIVFFSSADHTVDQIIIKVYDVDSTLINNVYVTDNYNGKVKNYSIDKFSYIADDVPLGQHFFSTKIMVNKIYRDFVYKKGIPVTVTRPGQAIDLFMPSKEGYAIVEKKMKKLMEDGKFEEAYKILLRTQKTLFGTELNLLKHEDLQIIKSEILNIVPDIELRIESSRFDEQFNNGTIENSFEKGRTEY